MQISSSAMTAAPSSRLAAAPDGLPVPGRLSLAFSSAADRGRIQRILDPDVKRIIDPTSWVVKRESHVHDPHLENGAFAMLVDENSDARAITCAYRITDPAVRTYASAPSVDSFREVGTSLSALNSGTGSIIIAAATLKAFMDEQGALPVVTEIMPQNKESMSAYRGLGYEDVKDAGLVNVLHTACNAGIAKENKGNPTDWLIATSQTVSTCAQRLLQAEASGFNHRASGKNISFNLEQALERMNLDRNELNQIAGGDFPVRGGRVIRSAQFRAANALSCESA